MTFSCCFGTNPLSCTIMKLRAQTFSVESFFFSSCNTELAGFLSYFCTCVIALIAKMFQRILAETIFKIPCNNCSSSMLLDPHSQLHVILLFSCSFICFHLSFCHLFIRPLVSSATDPVPKYFMCLFTINCLIRVRPVCWAPLGWIRLVINVVKIFQ